MTSSSESEFAHEAFISYAKADHGWAVRLRRDLGGMGVHSFAADFTVVGAGDTWSQALDSALDASRSLVVLWTPRAVDARGVLREIAAFEALARAAKINGTAPRRIVPVFFGESALAAAPPALRSRQGVVIDSGIYEGGPDAAAVEWNRAVEQICHAVLGAETGAQAAPRPQPAQALAQVRAWVMLDGMADPGWLVGNGLAVVLTNRDLNRPDLSIHTERTVARGAVSPWAEAHRRLLDKFALLRLTSDLSVDLPAGPSAPGRDIEIWGWSLARADASGVVGEPNPDGSFDLEIPEGSIQNGSAVWDAEAECFIGIAVLARSQRWRLMPIAAISKPAGQVRRTGVVPPPSARIHDDSWTVDDRLDYALYGRAIKEFIQHPDTRPPLVIGVQGPWGQGKTSLMRIAQDRLDPGHADLSVGSGPALPAPDGSSEVTFKDLRNSLDGDIAIGNTRPSEVRSVWFNAWKYQSSEALWAGLAHAILTQLPARLPRRTQELFWLKLNLRRIDSTSIRRDIHRAAFEFLLPRLVASAVAAIAISIVLAVVGATAAMSALGGLGGAGILAGASWVDAQRKALNRNLEGSFLRYVSQPDYAGKLGYLHHVEEDMRRALTLLAPNDEPTVIFIDDLDRCSASRIAEVLEAINLFLSGEYPNCVFVLGIDAEVVAAAMEIVHKEVLGHIDNQQSRLGWRFLEKFIQLSLVMPRLSERQKEAYLMSLLGVDPAVDRSAVERQTALDAEKIREGLVGGELNPDEAAQLVGALGADPAIAESRTVREVAEDVVAFGARGFSDADPETASALRRRLPHLSDNPRTIKRAVNLYRFYRFMAWAREASSADLEAAKPELIAGWTVVAARWPRVVHWLQVHGRRDGDPEAVLRKFWQDDEPELCAFLEDEKLDLKHAMACGLW